MRRCKAFVLGVMVGTIGGLLLAPKNGKEMRKDLLSKTEELKLKLKELNQLDSDELAKVIAGRIKEIRKSIEKFDWKASRDCAVEKFEEVKEKISDIGETISAEVAKKSDTPVVDATATPETHVSGSHVISATSTSDDDVEHGTSHVVEIPKSGSGTLDAVIENINSKYND